MKFKIDCGVEEKPEVPLVLTYDTNGSISLKADGWVILKIHSNGTLQRWPLSEAGTEHLSNSGFIINSLDRVKEI
jgi:hypothetical protein